MNGELVVSEWVEKAERDLEVAAYNLKGKFFDAAGFYAQQSIEKALKAVYIKKFGRLKKVHDLVMLGREVNLPKNLLKQCERITGLYVGSRYPGLAEEPSGTRVKRALSAARGVLEWCKDNI